MSAAVLFKTGPVYSANWGLTRDPSFAIGGIAINQGGKDSGKTTAIIQVICTIAVYDKPPIEDPIITCVSQTIPDAKKGAYRKFEEMVSNNPILQSKIKEWNKSERIVTFKSGWIVEFTSYVDEQSAKQGKRQYLFCNEAQSLSYQIFWQLASRTRKVVFIDYNPTAPFWAHEKLIGTTPGGNDLSVPVKLFISDHRHNPFLSEADHYKTENIKDPQLWRVYARGLTGNLTGIIYPDWKMIPDREFPWEDPSIFGGLDFGYTNDPTAGVRCCRIGDKIFVHELCYAPGIPAMKIKNIFQEAGFKTSHTVFCDHDGDMIRQLRTFSSQEKHLLEQALKNANSTEEKKALELKYKYTMRAVPGSKKIIAGINKVKEYKVFFTESSKNINYERQKYMWVIDPDTGKPMNEPVDRDNHLLDAIRYGIYTQFFRK